MAIETPRPFLKWAGGKSKSVSHILERIPATWDRETDLYVEPFVGAGAVFFALQPKHAVLNDANLWLMGTYRHVRDNVKSLIGKLEILQKRYLEQGEPYYYKIRDGSPTSSATSTWLETSAEEFIFLNKTCFNGLYRVNASGKFNVPWGKNPKPGFPTPEHLQCCSAVLQGTKLHSEDFAAPGFVSSFDPRGALIYCDPPYVPVSKTADFTKYTTEGFEYVSQLHLVVQAVYWRAAGARVILSQAADENLIDQYRRVGFRADLVQVRRAINSKGNGRGEVGEYIIY